MSPTPIVGGEAPSGPPLDELLKIDVQIPQLGTMDEADIAALATSNVMLMAHNKALGRACQSLKAQVDGFKAYYAAVPAPARVPDASDVVSFPLTFDRPLGYVSPYADPAVNGGGG